MAISVCLFTRYINIVEYLSGTNHVNKADSNQVFMRSAVLMAHQTLMYEYWLLLCELT